MPSTTFGGTRALPPAESLPEEVKEAVTAYERARLATGKAQAQLGNHRRVDVPQARQRDVEAAADALENGKPAPEPKHERAALDKLGGLERSVSAAELVERRSAQRMNETIEAHADSIGKAASERTIKAVGDYLTAVDALEQAVNDLHQARALSAWAGEPNASFKLRAALPVPLVLHSSDPPDVGPVIAGLREAIEPPTRAPMPSPLGSPAEQPDDEPVAAS
jgi:hypothetical protein